MELGVDFVRRGNCALVVIKHTSTLTGAIVFLLVAAVITSLLITSDASRGMENFFFDRISSTALTKSIPEDILLIVIDEKSLAELGRWPWSRRVHAKMINKLEQSKLRALGINLIFADAESTSADQELLAAIKASQRLVLPVTPQLAIDQSTMQAGVTITGLDDASNQRGHTDFALEDGVVREAFLKAGIGQATWPSFALAMWQVGSHKTLQNLPGARNKNSNYLRENSWVRDHQIIIPFIGPPGQFDRLSYAEVFDQNFDIDMLDSKMVLLGVEAVGIGDKFATPVSDNTRLMSGIELHANILAAFYNKQLITPLSLTATTVFTIILLIPVLAYFTLSWLHTLLLTTLQIISALLFSVFVLRTQSFWFDPSIAILLVAVSYPICISRTLKNTVNQLFQLRQHRNVVLDAIGDAVVTIDLQNRILYMNSSAEVMADRTVDESSGSLFSQVFMPTRTKQPNAIFEAIQKCHDSRILVRTRGPCPIENIQGKHLVVTATAGPIFDRKNRMKEIVVGITDVTENIRASEQLAFQATHDSLTNLPNRNLLLDRLNLAILRAARAQQMIAIIFIDLDQFKHINDGFGHAVGDQLLKAVAEKFSGCARDGDTIARLGGDEFVLLLEEITDANIAASVAYKILELANSPYEIDEHKLFVSCSVGISIYPKDGESAADLLKHADTAMYQVKSTGRNDLSYFSHEINQQTLRRLEIEKGLHNALRNREFSLRYQPQFSIKNGQITGVEALIRWQHKGEEIPPAEFVPIAEDAGLIFPIGDWVLHAACRQFMQWHRANLNPKKLAINISPRQMLNKEFSRVINNALLASELAAEHLELEITEHSIMVDLGYSAEVLREFKSIGCSIAIDDFGTGYSSLSYLKHLPVDTLKIDQSFIRDIALESEDSAITSAIITMAKGLNMQVIAEGVETTEQLRILSLQRCDEFQGYLKSTPLDPEQMADFLAKRI